jgi:hypothetical protein
MSLAVYLREHFVDRPAFAALAGINGVRLDELLALAAIPAPSYTCDGTAVSSAVFGRIPIDEPLAGEYFRPECVRWARIADQAPAGGERAAVIAVLAGEWKAALAASGIPAADVEAKVADWLPFFFDGTFGLCVADPSNGAAIARKELLQARLGAVTESGSLASPPGMPKPALLALIDDYAAAAMPFSPAEYARSSRKRLVDDLRPRVAATGDAQA